jgi:hypothetical protein
MDLVEDPTEKGTARTKVRDGRYLAEVSHFSVTIRELHAAHGHWNLSISYDEEASLLILRIQLVDHAPSHD